MVFACSTCDTHSVKNVRRPRGMFLRVCFCASLLHTQFTRHVTERALGNKMNNDRVDGLCYSCAWIERSSAFGDPYFSFDGLFCLPIFYNYRNNERNLLITSLNFSQTAPWNSVLYGSLVYLMRWFQMLLEGLSL